jgi:DNA repair protein RadC
MRITDMASVDRPREKLAAKGAAFLRDTELVAILLRTGVRGKSAVEVAESLLRAFPVARLREIRAQDLHGIPGVGGARGYALLAAVELGRRIVEAEKTDERTISSPGDIARLLGDIRTRKKEHFVAFYLDARNAVIGRETISVGTLNASLVHPREVFEPAVAVLASSLVLAHNHPSGITEPSEADIKVTDRLMEAGRIMGIEVMDHVIVAERGYYSFREAGRIGS